MRAVVLAAGYATRLYPLTLDRPKHLLEVAGQPILDRLLGQLPLGELDAVTVVTNAKFAPRFRDWAEEADYPVPIEVVDDGTSSDEDKLGAIGDLDLVVRTLQGEDDLLVAAGDSLFTERLDGFVRFAGERDAAAIAVYDVGDLEAMGRLSAVAVEADGRVTAFEEKPRAADLDTGRNRALLLPARRPAARLGVPGGGAQPRPARPVRGVALSADAGLCLARSGRLAGRGHPGGARRGRPGVRGRFALAGERPAGWAVGSSAHIRHTCVTDT